MAYKFWSKVGVSMASTSGMGAAIGISDISLANPAVVTYTGAVDPANGNYVYLELNGMPEANTRLYRVANVVGASNTFELEGLDATAFAAFSSGTFKVVTFDTSFSTLSEPSSGGGDPVFEDTTLIHDAKDKQAIVSSSPESYGFLSEWQPSNAALIEANKAFVTKTPRMFMVTFADNSRYLFSATVSAPLSPAASGRKVTTRVDMALENTGTSYST